MICTCIQHKSYEEILDILSRPEVEMAEIRLDLCELKDDEIEDLFSNSDTPLIATCRTCTEVPADEAERRLSLAIRSGARFADLEIEAPVAQSKRFRNLCEENGTEIIRSYHNFSETPSDEVLQMALARCFRYGADIAKIVTTCNSAEDAMRTEGLYSCILEDIDSLEGRLIAFGMGEEGRASRLECLRRGAPFTYAALTEGEGTAPGQWTTSEMTYALYGRTATESKQFQPWHREGLRVPASKSFAQRAIIAAALADGCSHLRGYSPCADSEGAIKVARALGADVRLEGDTLCITGTAGKINVPESLHVGESGLLTRLMIPILAACGNGNSSITGEGSLLRRPLGQAGEIMASFGVLLSDNHVPLTIKGKLVPGTGDISGKGGSQLISGLLMALPLCSKDSNIFVNEPKSIPYMYITLDVLRHFGIHTRSEMEGDAEMLEQQDWSYCTGISFKLRGGQHYKAADFDIEGDWSAAANFMVAGAIFGSAEIQGLDEKSLQADLAITNILVDAGAIVSQTEDGCIGVRKAPLEAFTTDLNNSPDIFPIAALLAAFCSGESRLSGLGRLGSKESDRAEAITAMLSQMGVAVRTEGDDLLVTGESLSSRLLGGRMLKGGSYSSHHDHRMVMALRVAELGAESPIVIDDEACVSKSFPGFSLD